MIATPEVVTDFRAMPGMKQAESPFVEKNEFEEASGARNFDD